MIVLIILCLISLSIFIFRHYKRSDETADSDWGPDGRPEEPALSKLAQAQMKLDSDIYRMLTTKEPGYFGEPIFLQTNYYLKELISEAIEIQLKRRIEPSALIPIVDPQEKARQESLETLRSIMSQNSIPDAWILANGGFKPTPFHELYPWTPLPSSVFEDGPEFLQSDILRRRSQAESKYDDECNQGYHRHFGWSLPFDKLEDIPHSKINTMLEFNEKLIVRFKESSAYN